MPVTNPVPTTSGPDTTPTSWETNQTDIGDVGKAYLELYTQKTNDPEWRKSLVEGYSGENLYHSAEDKAIMIANGGIIDIVLKGAEAVLGGLLGPEVGSVIGVLGKILDGERAEGTR